MSVQDTSDILKLLIAADELFLQELIDYLQKYLIENESEWVEQHFELIHRTSFQFNSLSELQRFCTDFMAKSPEKIFKSFDFTSLPEKSLVSLIKRDDLQMKEVEVWEHVLKWGLAQNPTLIPDPSAWSDDDFKTMENTLQCCLPSVRFFSLSPKEFSQKVHPYKKLLKHQLYDNLLKSYLDPDSVSIDNVTLPRIIGIRTDEIIDSNIVNLGIASVISRWIDKVSIDNKFAQFRELYLPYKFELLLRGSRDGFTPKRFHELCNNKLCTVTFIKVKETEEILGGYNPIVWFTSFLTSEWGKTKDSFIFSFKNKNNFFKDAILSNVSNTNYAMRNRGIDGPTFGLDLLVNSNTLNDSIDCRKVYCKKYYYERIIRDTENQLSIEDYEVFQIVKR